METLLDIEEKSQKRLTIITEINSCLRDQNYSTIDSLLVFALKKPIDSEILVKLGHLMYRLNNYPKAEIIYNHVLENEQSTNVDDALFGLGQTYFKLKRYSDSFLRFTILLNNYPDYKCIDLVTLKVSLIYKFINDFNSTLTSSLKLLNKKNLNKNVCAEALCIIGSCYELQGKIDLSNELYYKAAEKAKSFRTVTCMA